MRTAVVKAIALILSGDRELVNILMVTARMSISSSLIALIIGVPLGILLGAVRFRGRSVLIIADRTLMGMPPVVCGLLFYMLFSGVGPFRHLKLLFTVPLMVLAQVVLITPLVIGNMENYVSGIAEPVKETARGLGLTGWKVLKLLVNECAYVICSTYLLAFSRAIAEVGAISMVGGAIAWKTNVMTTAIMQYTNRGNFTLGVALGLILMALSLLVNIMVTVLQRVIAR
ncbi:MAG: ABC transporter permease [Clostridium sp.]|nr:ABC transporter permease [Clostridium sp.]